ncbi:MAG: oxygen-dependent coproporphyrinogen oxidase [Gammaproteobacteria bacterium]|nr:oxygen-dependent coproporphyrinogen oxidase [Gammaproteobacteria bacterium]
MQVEHAIAVVEDYFLQLQQQIAAAIMAKDPRANLTKDNWRKEQSGYGQTWVVEAGAVFEKAAVNFSHVSGEALPAAALEAMQVPQGAFRAMGVSLIIHPDSPFVPTTHMNVRFFLMQPTAGEVIWWFGGGYDLTPYYGFEQDCIHWHKTAKSACTPFAEKLYDELKAECDRYFFLHHRNEARGIGGLFFDHFNRFDFDKSFAFTRSVGDTFIPAYMPIVEQRCHQPFGEKEKMFQCYRRGRYVEFNLVYDRGTLFGLQFGGRIESILCSMPPQVNWHYNWQPQPGGREAELYEKFLPARDWLSG